jgi:hypothetical protein
MTPEQTRLIHIAQRQLEMNDRQYRMILKHVADCSSSSQLTNSSFEDVMALFEERGFRHQGKPADYWRNKVQLRGAFAGERMVRKIHALLEGTKYSLAGLCDRFTQGRTREVTKLNPQEAYNLVEMLKKVQERIAPNSEFSIQNSELQQASLFPAAAAAAASDLNPQPQTLNPTRHGGRPLENAAAQSYPEEPF